VDSSRYGLFGYLTADETAGYLAIMDLFSATLLTDLSAVEVAFCVPAAPFGEPLAAGPGGGRCGSGVPVAGVCGRRAEQAGVVVGGLGLGAHSHAGHLGVLAGGDSPGPASHPGG
jgi:hypothetical protein